jgi:hypothetical protein
MWTQHDHTATERRSVVNFFRIKNLQCERSAIEMRRKRYMTRLSIRWLRVRVPSPSLDSKVLTESRIDVSLNGTESVARNATKKKTPAQVALNGGL